jgi:hypothetical protein
MYTVLPYTKQQARKIGVTVKPSTNPKKKVDVFEAGKKVASIGATGYKDYPTFMKKDGKAIAEERRRLYHIRHKKDAAKKGTPGYYASLLLW